ncbi:MAG: hypothetical protein DRO23_00670 [Thermoprotei archaeon]|nr:MAG: hypothetical protein DRO23_00670 [Thermoprotei archaeon]
MLVKRGRKAFSTILKQFEHKREVMRKYDITSKGYDELYGDEQLDKYRLAFKNINDVGKTVLDVGCGTGLLYSFINSKKQQFRSTGMYIGIDISYGMLEKAKPKIDQGTILAELIRADADFLPFRSKVFDSVFAFTLLQNMPNPNVTCYELLRVLKDKGLLILSIPKSTNVNIDLQVEKIEKAKIKDTILLLKLNNRFTT